MHVLIASMEGRSFVEMVFRLSNVANCLQALHVALYEFSRIRESRTIVSKSVAGITPDGLYGKAHLSSYSNAFRKMTLTALG